MTPAPGGLTGLAASTIALGLPLEGLTSHAARLASVTPEDVQRLAARLFADEALCVLIVGDSLAVGDVRKLWLGPPELRDGYAEPVL